MRAINKQKATNYNAVLDDIAEVVKSLPFSSAEYIKEEDNYKDGLAILFLPSPYNLTNEQAQKVFGDGRFSHAMVTADNAKIYCSGDTCEIRIFFVVNDVWQTGNALPAYMTTDVNELVAKKMGEHGFRRATGRRMVENVDDFLNPDKYPG